jgi:hypothetical protein
MRKYQNSYCRGSWLHKFRTVQEFPDGAVERCERCGLQKYFRLEAKLIYLSYHLREILKPNDPLFIHEYPKQ